MPTTTSPNLLRNHGQSDSRPAIASRRRLLRSATLIAALSICGVLAHAQQGGSDTESAPAPRREASTESTGQTGRRGNANREDMQARMLTNLRTQFDVKDDSEWALIAERITKIMELRRSAVGGGFGMGGFRGGSQNNRAAQNPEVEALRTALDDKLPDAEVKARIEKLRAARKQAEAKFDQAREDLRSVLTFRQ